MRDDKLIEAMARAIAGAPYYITDTEWEQVRADESEHLLRIAEAKMALAAAEAAGYRLVPDNWTREWAHELARLRGCSYEGAVTLIYDVLAAAPDHSEQVRPMVSKVGRND